MVSNYHQYQEYYQNYNKEYYLKNGEKIKEQKKEYYEQFKNKIICDCGKEIVRISMPKHLKSKKHLNFIAENKI
jgi:hypothetical protein